MAVKKRLKKVTNIEQITVCITSCPGCHRQHDIHLSRPESTKNCSYGTGTFRVNVSSVSPLKGGGLELSVKFTPVNGAEIDITESVTVELANE